MVVCLRLLVPCVGINAVVLDGSGQYLALRAAILNDVPADFPAETLTAIIRGSRSGKVHLYLYAVHSKDPISSFARCSHSRFSSTFSPIACGHRNYTLQRIPRPPHNHQRLRYTIRRVAPLPRCPRNIALRCIPPTSIIHHFPSRHPRRGRIQEDRMLQRRASESQHRGPHAQESERPVPRRTDDGAGCYRCLPLRQDSEASCEHGQNHHHFRQPRSGTFLLFDRLTLLMRGNVTCTGPTSECHGSTSSATL